MISLISFTKYDENTCSDKELLISSSADSIKIWDLESNSRLRTIEISQKTLANVFFLKRDGVFHLLASTKEKTIELIDLEEGSVIASFLDKSPVNCILQIPVFFDFSGFISGSEEGILGFWKYGSSEKIDEIPVEVAINSLASFEDYDENTRLAIVLGLKNAKIMVIDAVSKKLLTTMVHAEKGQDQNPSITCLDARILDETRVLISGCSNGTLRVWNAKNGDLLRNFEENTEISCAKAEIFKGKFTVFAGGLDGKGEGEVKAWRLEEEKSFVKWRNYGFGAKSLCFMKKYDWLAVAWNNGFRVLKLEKI